MWYVILTGSTECDTYILIGSTECDMYILTGSTERDTYILTGSTNLSQNQCANFLMMFHLQR